MSLRLARFKQPMSKVAKERRALRRKRGTRVSFAFIRKGVVYFKHKYGHYTQAELKQVYGLVVPIPKFVKQKIERNRARTRNEGPTEQDAKDLLELVKEMS